MCSWFRCRWIEGRLACGCARWIRSGWLEGAAESADVLLTFNIDGYVLEYRDPPTMGFVVCSCSQVSSCSIYAYANTHADWCLKKKCVHIIFESGGSGRAQVSIEVSIFVQIFPPNIMDSLQTSKEIWPSRRI